MKIRDAKPEELVQPARAKKLSPRQQAAQEREAKFRKLLESLSDPAQIKVIEPEKGEKLGTLRASLTKVLQGDHRLRHPGASAEGRSEPVSHRPASAERDPSGGR